jgi:hypothetical protein
MHKRELVVKEACHEPWEEMQGGASQRRCESCEQDVHDLSAMTRTEAKMVLARRAVGQRLCVRFASDEKGRVLFRPEPLIPAVLLVRGRQLALGAGLAVAALGGCAPAGTAIGSAASHQMADELIGPRPNVMLLYGACAVSLEPLLPLTLQLHARGCAPASGIASPPELMEVPRTPPPPPPNPPPLVGAPELLRPAEVQPAQKRPAQSSPKKTTPRKPRRQDITMGYLL